MKNNDLTAIGFLAEKIEKIGVCNPAMNMRDELLQKVFCENESLTYEEVIEFLSDYCLHKNNDLILSRFIKGLFKPIIVMDGDSYFSEIGIDYPIELLNNKHKLKNWLYDNGKIDDCDYNNADLVITKTLCQYKNIDPEIKIKDYFNYFNLDFVELPKADEPWR